MSIASISNERVPVTIVSCLPGRGAAVLGARALHASHGRGIALRARA